VHISALADDALAIACSVAAMLAGRAAAVYTLGPLVSRFAEPMPRPWQHVLFWGGLRGSLSIALALSLPATVADRQPLVTMIFGTVLFSLLAQGLTMRPALVRLGFTEVEGGCAEHELLQATLLAETAAIAELDAVKARGGLTDKLYRKLRDSLAESHDDLGVRLAELEAQDHVLEREQERRILDHLTDVRRARLAELVREGLVSEAAYEELRRRLDQAASASADGGPPKG
jgi:CPA1 family monovalent cation:H+ antiporter